MVGRLEVQDDMEFKNYFCFRVDRPNGIYNGQVLIRLVPKKIIANTPSIIAVVPEMTFMKYRTPTNIASSVRTVRSIVPMFFFIVCTFG